MANRTFSHADMLFNSLYPVRQEELRLTIATSEMYQGTVFPEERGLVSSAVTSRQQEFIAGRNAARAGLLALGQQPHPILSERDRTPRWPVGFVGSISHCEGFCAAVVGRFGMVKSLGLDAELYKPLSLDIIELISSHKERMQLSALGLGNSEVLIFSMKEAFYKCYYQIAKRNLDFHEVELSITNSGFGEGIYKAGAFTVRLIENDFISPTNKFAGKWLIDGRHVFAGATLYQ